MTRGLYNPRLERDACGFGLLANLDGNPSHRIVADALAALERMTHRGAVAADGLSGDGCGILLALPGRFIRSVTDLPEDQAVAVGMVFLAADGDDEASMRAIEDALTERSWAIGGWRDVPVEPSVIGDHARKTLPRIRQVFASRPGTPGSAELERSLFLARRAVESQFNPRQTYIASLSTRTIAYKGLCLPGNLPRLYPDLRSPELETSIAVFHQRFSTNTTPSWRLSQPFRLLAHNGEINTIAGNRAWAHARHAKWHSPVFEGMRYAAPEFSPDESDSASLDQMLEFLI
ncbi:MAG: glutamate synthase large subunit, partial [Xanthomonadales bacterium]|nr:glutamate synthase large subunit [Xanthomonadales bacterium]